jgi:hypothetical protein
VAVAAGKAGGKCTVAGAVVTTVLDVEAMVAEAAGTGSNPVAGAVAGTFGTFAEAPAGGRGRCTGCAAIAPFGGDKVNRCPGQIVYGGAIPFHCARSRKSTPLRNAIEYKVSLLTTT